MSQHLPLTTASKKILARRRAQQVDTFYTRDFIKGESAEYMQ